MPSVQHVMLTPLARVLRQHRSVVVALLLLSALVTGSSGMERPMKTTARPAFVGGHLSASFNSHIALRPASCGWHTRKQSAGMRIRCKAPSESVLSEVEAILEKRFGAGDDIGSEALVRRGLTEGLWTWRDNLVQKADAQSSNLFQTVLSRSMSNLRKSSYVLDPETLTYGEFPLDFFTKLIAAAEPTRGEVFCDVGSGCGRLVLAAALLWSDTFSCARGIEISSDLHTAASAIVLKN